MPRPSGMIRLVHWLTVTHVAEEFPAYLGGSQSQIWYIPTKLYGVTSRNEALYSLRSENLEPCKNLPLHASVPQH